MQWILICSHHYSVAQIVLDLASGIRPPQPPTKLPLDYINTPPSFSKQCFKKCVLSSSFLAPGLGSSTSSKSPGFFQWGEYLKLPIWVFGVVTGNLKYTQARTWG